MSCERLKMGPCGYCDMEICLIDFVNMQCASASCIITGNNFLIKIKSTAKDSNTTLTSEDWSFLHFPNTSFHTS